MANVVPSDAPKDVLVGAESRPMPFIKRWLVMPKLLYFMLNMFIYAFHGIMFMIVVHDWHFGWIQYALFSCITAANFVGSFVWPPLADKTGRYKTIIAFTAVSYTLVACLLAFPPKFENSTVKYVFMTALLFFFNFFLSAPFPLVDAQVMGMLVSDPRFSRDQFGNQRMFGCIGHFLATLLIFGAKEYTKNRATIFWRVSYTTFWYSVIQIIITAIFLLVVYFGIPNVKPVKAGHHGHHAKKKAATSTSPVSMAASPMSTMSTTSNGIPADAVKQAPLEQTLPMAPTPAPPCAVDELTAAGTAKVRHPIVTLLTNGSFMMLMLFVIFAGVVRSVTAVFVKPITFRATNENIMKTASTEGTRVISEIAIYLMAPLLKRTMGSYWILVMSQVVGVMRMVGYWALNPDLSDKSEAYKNMQLLAIYGLELLKGLSSGLISSSAITIAGEIAPDGCEASAQGLYSGVYSGLSTLFGGLLSAGVLHYLWRDRKPLDTKNLKGDAKKAAQEAEKLEDARGIQAMFLWVSVMTSVVTVMMAAKFIFIDRVMGLPGFPRRRQSLAH